MAEFDILQYSGKEIYQLDLKGDGPEDQEQVEEAIEEMKEEVASQPEDSVLALTLVEGLQYNKDIVERLKDLTDSNREHVRKSAIVGVGGLQKVALQGVKRFSGREFEQFDDVESAKQYLVE